MQELSKPISTPREDENREEKDGTRGESSETRTEKERTDRWEVNKTGPGENRDSD